MQLTTARCDRFRASLLASLIFGLGACQDDNAAGDLPGSLGSTADASQIRDSELFDQGNAAPRIFGTPPFQAFTGQSFRFSPEASDSDGDRLGFSVRNLPKWATFNPKTGELNGIPAGEDVGSTGEIVISVSDGKVGTALAGFRILITNFTSGSGAGSRPTISGTPEPRAHVNELYEFQPSANDPDGQSLSFGVVNQPAWLHLDSTTGRLVGQPDANDIGIYFGILITVSDGVFTDFLGPFSIDVGGLGSHSVTLNWSTPQENEDGSVLTDLRGYEIRFGPEPGGYGNLIDVRNPGSTNYTVNGLASGTYYFTASAYNLLGITSDLSNEVSISLQ